MPKYSIILDNEIETLNKNFDVRKSMGFIIKYDSKHYIVSTHHFLPIFDTNLNTHSKKIKLKKIKDIYWNELNIFEPPDFKYLHNTTVIKNIKTRFLEPKTLVKLQMNENIIKFEKSYFECIDYTTNFPNIMSNLSNIYLRFDLGKKQDYLNLNKLMGLSGSPILSKDDSLVGIFCKFEIQDDNILGWALPSIYLIKSLNKIDNKNLYYIDYPSFDNIKIGQYDVQLISNTYFIHYLPVNTKIPLNIFFTIEGDENKKVQIKDMSKNEILSVTFKKDDSFDISTDLERIDNKFKLNHGLYSLLIFNNHKEEVYKIIDKYKNKNDDEELNQIDLSKLLI